MCALSDQRNVSREDNRAKLHLKLSAACESRAFAKQYRIATTLTFLCNRFRTLLACRNGDPDGYRQQACGEEKARG